MRRCPDLGLPTRGRECIVDGPAFDAVQNELTVFYGTECELVAIEVRMGKREN